MKNKFIVVIMGRQHIGYFLICIFMSEISCQDATVTCYSGCPIELSPAGDGGLPNVENGFQSWYKSTTGDAASLIVGRTVETAEVDNGPLYEENYGFNEDTAGLTLQECNAEDELTYQFTQSGHAHSVQLQVLDLATQWTNRLQVEVKVNGQVMTDDSYSFDITVDDSVTITATVNELAGGVWPSITWQNVDVGSINEQQGSAEFEKTFTSENTYNYKVKSQVCNEESQEFLITVTVTAETADTTQGNNAGKLDQDERLEWWKILLYVVICFIGMLLTF